MSKRTLQIVLTGLTIVALYVGAFFAIRDSTYVTDAFVTDPDADCRLHSIKLYYFSKNPAVNSALFCLFYPIHAFVGNPYRPADLSRQSFDDFQPNRPYYLYDTTVILAPLRD